MENPIAPAGSVFKSLFRQHLPTHIIQRIFERNGPARRRPPVLTPAQLIMGLTFHVVADRAGTAQSHRRRHRTQGGIGNGAGQATARSVAGAKSVDQ